MSGRIGKRVCGWILLALFAAAPAARAEQATYTVRGLGGAAFWGLGAESGTEAIVLAFSDVTPEKGEDKTPGPRLVFSVTQWASVNGVWVRRQWHGDVPLDKTALEIALDLQKGTLKATVEGTLEEQRLDGSMLRKKVKGAIDLSWAASSGILPNSTSNVAYQTPAHSTILATVGSGRIARVTGTVTVEGIDGVTRFDGFGQLASIADGKLSVTTP